MARAAATGGLERPGFLKVPHALLDAAPELRLAPAHLLVALRLLADCQWEPGPVRVRRVGIVQLDAGEAVCGTRNLARRLHLYRDTVRRALERLEAVGWFSFRPAGDAQIPPLKAPLGAAPTRRQRGTPPPTIARVLVWRDVQWPTAEAPAPTPDEEAAPTPRAEAAQNPPRSKTPTETVLQARKGEKGNGAVEAERATVLTDPPAASFKHVSREDLDLEADLLCSVPGDGAIIVEVAEKTGRAVPVVESELRRLCKLGLVRQDTSRGVHRFYVTADGRKALASAQEVRQ